MIRIDELLGSIATLQRSDLEAWIADALVKPQVDAGALTFSEVEGARVRLICTLRYELEVETDTLPIVLSLLDQLHAARAQIKALGEAVTAQEAPVREAILAAIAQRMEPT